MSSTFWFLLEFSVLLALTAICFGWFGWMCRGSGRVAELRRLEKEIDEQRRMARAAMDERDAARAEVRDSSVHVSDAARIIHESEVLEAENTRLRDELATARRELAAQAGSHGALDALQAEIAQGRQALSELRHEHDAAVAGAAQKAREAAETAEKLESALRAAETEIAALRQQITQHADAARDAGKLAEALQNDLQAARDQISHLEAGLAAAHAAARQAATDGAAAQQSHNELAAARAQVSRLEAELAVLREAASVSPSVPPAPSDDAPRSKPTRTRSAPSKKSRAPAASAEEKLAQITDDLSTPLAVIAALMQERDDWRRRVTTLESKTPPDPAGLALARRSLAGSEERLATAEQAVESLQNQRRALEKALSQAAALNGVPDDDLTRIKGIKKVLSDQLHAHGIRTWRQIAGWDEDDLRAFSELLAFKNRAARDHWQEQAQKLMQQA